MEDAEEKMTIQHAHQEEVFFRTATLDDLTAITHLWRHAHWSQKMLCGPRCVKREFARRAILSDSVELWLAECDGALAGVFCLVRGPDQWRRDRRLPLFYRVLRKLFKTTLEMNRIFFAKKHGVQTTVDKTARSTAHVPAGEAMWLSYVVVSPRLRGRGVGSASMAYLEDRVIKEGKTVIRMHVHPCNIVMRIFCEKHGYVDCGSAADGYRNYAKALTRS